MREWGVVNGYRVSVWVINTFWKYIVTMIAQRCEGNECHEIVHLK